jgi:hypothetical protein
MLVIAINRERFRVTGDHDHSMMRLTNDGALRPQVLIVRKWVLDERLVGEPIGRIIACADGHEPTPSTGLNAA